MLADNLKTLLGSTFVLYTKIHGFHWNCEGEDFPQYHKFLNDYYSTVYETIDKIGEYIRILDSYAPGSLSRMLELSIISEQTKIPRASLMLEELLADTERMIEFIKPLFEEATQNNEQAIANYLADLQDIYGKHRWILRSVLKKSRG